LVLGHALCVNASHGGKANNDTIDAHKIAALLRGGLLPKANVYPATRRATPIHSLGPSMTCSRAKRLLL
jgi:hypothetical protein